MPSAYLLVSHEVVTRALKLLYVGCADFSTATPSTPSRSFFYQARVEATAYMQTARDTLLIPHCYSVGSTIYRGAVDRHCMFGTESRCMSRLKNYVGALAGGYNCFQVVPLFLLPSMIEDIPTEVAIATSFGS